MKGLLLSLIASFAQQPQSNLVRLHQMNQQQIAMSEIAVLKGSPNVARFADRMIRDHRLFENNIVTENSQTVSESIEIPRGTLEMLRQLSATWGKEFDDLYLTAVATDHSDVIDDLLQAIAENKLAKPDKILMRKVLPLLQQHEILALNLRGEDEDPI